MRAFLVAVLLGASLLASAQTSAQTLLPPQRTLAIVGQSQAMGAGDKALSPVVTTGVYTADAYAMIPTAITWVPGNRDPQSALKGSASFKSITGSLVPSLCQRLRQLDSTREVRVTNYAQNGSFRYVRPGENVANNWGPGGQLRTGAFAQIDQMLASPACKGQLDALVILLGETDFYRQALYPTQIELFPNGYVVDSCVSLTTGAFVAYAYGYPNPTNIPDLYSAYRELYTAFATRYPTARLIVPLTADCTGGTGSACSITHTRGIRRARWVQLRVIKDMEAVGFAIQADRLSLTFAPRGLLNADGVHYGQAALNELGARLATRLTAPTP